MAGTRAGGLRAAATIKKKHGEDFFEVVGRQGGKTPKKTPSGFGYLAIHDPEKLRQVSARGGQLGKRGPVH